MSVYGSTSTVTFPLESGVRVPADSVVRERRTTVLQGAMIVVVLPRQDRDLIQIL